MDLGSPTPDLDTGRVYRWDELGPLFGFKPRYFGAKGGIIPAPRGGAVILITHPGGGKSFNYDDYWDGRDLNYTGEGKKGDQTFDRGNGDVGENRGRLLVFEHAGPFLLRFLGEAQCKGHWRARGIAGDGAPRLILRTASLR